MAITVAFYGLTMEKIAEQVGNDVNYLTGVVQLSLHTDVTAPDRDVHNFFDDMSTNELASGNGYTTLGETAGSKTITYDTASDQVRWDLADITWTFTASKTWRYGVVWINTAGASSTDPLYALLSWDSNQTVSTAYTLQFDPAGLLFVDTT
jgi:hypothetical protein